MGTGLGKTLLMTLVLIMNTACQEKATKAKKLDTSTEPTEKSCAEDPSQEKCRNTEPTPTGAFDICNNGLNDLGSSFSSLVSDFCRGGYKEKVDAKIYKAEDYQANSSSSDITKIIRTEATSPDAKDQITYTLFVAMELDTAPSDYFEMLKLQQTKPDVFGDEFDVDGDASVCNVKFSGSSSELEYLNNSKSDVVHYVVEQKYNILRSDEAYRVTSTLTENFQETLRDLRAINLSVKSGSKTMLYVISYQQVFRNEQSNDVILDKALEHMREDLRRTYKNAQIAYKAKELSKNQSNPSTQCQ